MAKKTIQVNIPEPCHEDWSKMTATQCGAFCKACSKEVIDFTNKSDAQIVEILSQTKGKVCGRFTADKLDKPLVKFEPDPEWYSWKKWAVAAGVLLGVGYVSADVIDQNPKPNTDNAAGTTPTQLTGVMILTEPTALLHHLQVNRPLADTAKVISDSTYNSLTVADTSVAIATTCTRLANPSEVDTTIVLMRDTFYTESDTTAVIEEPFVTMGEIVPVVMGKMVATPQKDKKPKKER